MQQSPGVQNWIGIIFVFSVCILYIATDLGVQQQMRCAESFLNPKQFCFMEHQMPNQEKIRNQSSANTEHPIAEKNTEASVLQAAKPESQAAASSFIAPPAFRVSAIQRKMEEATLSSSESLDASTKPELESFLSADLSQVQIHNNAASQAASNLIQAKAYTTGNHIFLGAEANAMSPVQRKELLAHEVVHTIQQKSLPAAASIQAKSSIDAPGSTHEQEADSIAAAFTQSQGGPYRSGALQMRSNMRISPMLRPGIQRSVKTSGGEWDTEQYDLVTPASPEGSRGLDIKLKFTPADTVDAELIGLSQSVQAFINNATALTPAAATRSIAAKDAIGINTGAGETDEGTAIDRAGGYNNPIYPVDNQSSSGLDDTSTSPGWGQNGWRYKDANGALKTQDAKLIDGPRRSGAQKNARHIFETTALATKGTQTGTYYGSVRWGWRTDDSGNFTKLPLSVVSQGVPSSSFMKAAELWNKGKSSTGAANVPLPVSGLEARHKIERIRSRLRGWTTSEEIQEIIDILNTVPNAAEMAEIRRVIEPEIVDGLSDIGDRTRVRVALARL